MFAGDEISLSSVDDRHHDDGAVIRVFVSSTFLDLQNERDELVKFVFPELRSIAVREGVEVYEVDLRWGIPDDQIRTAGLVTTCLAEIDRCRPYFVGIVGHRYGTTVGTLPPHVIERQHWLQDYAAKSITEIEMDYGVLRPDAPDCQALFYLKEDPGEVEASPEVLSLKERIYSSGHAVRTFEGPSDFRRMILNDLRDVVERQIATARAARSDSQRLDSERAFLVDLQRAYVSRPKVDNAVAKAVRKSRPLLIFGAAGSGKSSLLCDWAIGLQRGDWSPGRPSLLRRWKNRRADQPANGVRLIAHFVGASTVRATWQSIVRDLIDQLRDVRANNFPARFVSDGALVRTLHLELSRACAASPVVLLIDGLDLAEHQTPSAKLGWLPTKLPPGLQLIISSSEIGHRTEAGRRGWDVLVLDALDRREIAEVTNSYLWQFGKTLGPRDLTVIQASSGAKSPLFLSLVLEEARHIGDHRVLSESLERYAKAGNITELVLMILDRLEIDYGKDRADLVGAALSLLVCSRSGLTEAEVLDMLGADGGVPFPSAIWAPLRNALDGWFIERSGLISFAHPAIPSIVERRYVDGQRSQVHRSMAAYFSSRSQVERSVSELAWHLQALSDRAALYELLCTPATLSTLWSAGADRVRALWAFVQSVPGLRMVDAYGPNTPALSSEPEVAMIAASLLGGNGHVHEALFTLEQLAVEQASISESTRSHLDLLRAELLLRLGRYEHALRLWMSQIEFSEQVGDEPRLAIALGNAAVALGLLSRFDEERILLEREHVLLEKIDDQVGLAANAANMGIAHFRTGDFDSARTWFTKQETLSQLLGDTDGLQKSLNHLALVDLRCGSVDDARLALSRAEETVLRRGDRRASAATLGTKARMAEVSGDYDRALVLFEERVRLCRQLEDPHLLCRALLQQAAFLRNALRQHELALPLEDEAFDVAQTAGPAAVQRLTDDSPWPHARHSQSKGGSS